MKNKYLIRGVVVAGSLSLLTACQHYNKSYSENTYKGFPTETVDSQKSTNQISSIKIDNNTTDQTVSSAAISNYSTKNVDFSKVFANLSDDGLQAEMRKELLMSLSKPGENLFRDAADKKERKATGIKAPGYKMGIEEMADYRREITMPLGTKKMLYKDGFLERAYESAIQSPILAEAKASKYNSGKPSAYSLSGVTFTERGPNNVPGRGRSLVVSPTNPNKWYNGTAGGGVWITEDAGLTWNNTTDFSVPNLATSTIAISPANPNIVFSGTGEPFGNLDNITGSGVLKSIDAGATWTYLSNTSTFGSVGRIVIDPADANKVLVSTSNGVFRSTNGGTSWTQTYSGGNVQDLKATNNFGAIYGGVNSNGVIKSTDGGATWVTSLPSPTGAQRIEIAISPVDNNRIYLSVHTGSTVMYYSKDAGATWSLLTYSSGDAVDVLGGQGWYDNVIIAHPFDVNVAYVGGVSTAKITVNPTANSYTVKSIASGYVSGKLNTYVHPDQHGLVAQINPANSAQFRLLINNDGGVWYTDYKTNPGETQNDFKVKSAGLNNTQFYGADKKKGADAYVAGAQDNGSWATADAAIPAAPTTNYTSLLGGDGFEALWNYNDTKKLIFGSQYNSFSRTVNGVGSTVSAARNADNGSAKSPFYSKLANANNNPDVIFTVSSTGVWRSPDFGANWTVSPFNLTANGDWRGSQSAATVKVSVADPKVVWAAAVGSNSTAVNFKINLSRDNGQTFEKVPGALPINGSYFISGLSTSSVNRAQAYVLFSVPGMSKVTKTSDFGVTWSDITGYSTNTPTGFPDVPVHSLIEMPFDQNVLWAGTDIGVFETVNGGASWYLVTALPPVSVWGMKIVDDQVILATHGRGIWTATIPELSNYVLPVYVAPPSVKSIQQAGIQDMKAKAVFNYTSSSVTDLKVFVDNVYQSTITGTVPNTDYTYTTSSALSEGVHTISVSGVNGPEETIKESKSVEIIAFNAGAQNVNIPTFAATDLYIGSTGNFVVNNLASKFTYNVLNNNGHPYANNTTYQTYLRTPINVSANAKETLTHMAFTEAGYDFAIVEASKDLVNWIPVGTFDESSYSEWDKVTTAAAVTEDKFKNSDLDFSSSFTSGDQVAVRFRLTTDPADTRYGWILKSIVPTTTLATNDNAIKAEQILIAPNPAGETTNLMLPSNVKGNVTIGIYDASGKIIKTISKTAASRIELDVRTLEKGIYLLLVKTESGNKALKLMKK